MKTAAGVLLAVCLCPAAIFGQAIAYDFSKLYETASPGVVQITTDEASGSGFLITPFGHIATNYHVIRNSRYLAVQFPDGRKVRAEVVAANPPYDMAVLKVNSDVVHDIRPLPILPAEKDADVKVGIPVVAIGSPLNQKFLMTQGILSKVDDSTVLGDFLLQSGNSGGPLMNLDGEVVAINTFGEGSIAGAMRIYALRVFLTSPELLAQSIAVEPPPDQMRSVSDMRYPVDVLNQKIATETLDLDAYKFEAGDFNVTAITPVLLGKLQAASEKRRASNRQHRLGGGQEAESLDEPYYEWHRSTEPTLDMAVIFDVRPGAGPAKRSIVSRILPPPLRFGAGPTEMEFKGEFFDLRVYRDGELIEPILPGRIVVEGSSDRKNRPFVDQAYAGSYVYAPEEFLTGSEFRVQIIDARAPEAVHKELVFDAASKLIKQLRADFGFGRGILISQAP